MRAVFVLLPALLLVLAACGDAARPAPTTAQEVAERVSERFEANVGSVPGFVVRAAGAEASYTVSPDSASMDWIGLELAPIGDARPDAEAALLDLQVPNARRLGAGLGQAEFGGIVTRDGRQAFELITDDPGVLIGEPGVASPDSSQTLEFRVYIDPETFDVLEVYQASEIDTMSTPVTGRTIYSDFRTVDGLTLPYSIRRVETGLNQMITDEDRMIVGGQLGLRRQQLEGMPAGAERDAARAQLDAEQRLINEGVMDQTLTIQEVTVRDETPEPTNDEADDASVGAATEPDA